MKKKCALAIMVLLLAAACAGLTACTQKKLHKVVFDYNFENAEKLTVNIADGDSAKSFTPHRDNHNFTGWYEDQRAVTKYDFRKVTNDITIYAGWEKSPAAGKTIEISFIGESVEIAPVKVEAGSKLYRPEAEKDGHDAVWYLNGQLYNFEQEVNEPMTLELRWIKQDRSVQFVGYNDEDLGSVTVKYGDPIIASPRAEHEWKDFFTFAGWDHDIDAVTDNMRVKALFEYNAHDSDSFEFTLLSDGTYSMQRKEDGFVPSTHLALPGSYNGRPVSEITWMSDTEAESIYVPGNIKKVKGLDTQELKTVIFEEGVIEIAGYTLAYCPDLEEIIIPSSVRSISGFLFGLGDYPENYEFIIDQSNPSFALNEGSLYNHDISRLIIANQNIEEFVLPASVTEMEYARFWENSVLKAFTISGALKYLPAGTFTNSSIEKLIINGSIEIIGGSITGVEVDPMLKLTCGGAFDSCNIRELVFPAGLKKIETAAFGNGLRRLTKIILPSSIEFIDQEAFGGSDRFQNLSILAMNNGTESTNGKIIVKNNTLFLRESGGDILVMYARRAEGETFTVSPGAIKILPFAFAENENLREVIFQNEMEILSPRVFYGAENLESVKLPAALKRIESRLDKWAAVEYMRVRGTFEGARRLKSINLEETALEYIGQSCFVDTGLTEIFIPASVSEIGMPNFYTYPEDMDDLSPLLRFRVGAGSPYFSAGSDGVLYTADGKTLVCYPMGKTGSYIVPEGVETVGEGAFCLAWQMTGVTLPTTLKYIEDSAFLYCLMMSSVTFLGEVPPILIGHYQFYLDDGPLDTEIVVPAGSLESYYKAFIKDGYNQLLKTAASDMVTYNFVTEHGTAPATVKGIGITVLPMITDYSGSLFFEGWYSGDGSDGWGEKISFPYVYSGGNEVTLYAKFGPERVADGSNFYFAYDIGLGLESSRTVSVHGDTILYLYWAGGTARERVLDLFMDWDEGLGINPFEYVYKMELFYPSNLNRPISWQPFGTWPLYFVIHFDNIPSVELTFYVSDYVSEAEAAGEDELSFAADDVLENTDAATIYAVYSSTRERPNACIYTFCHDITGCNNYIDKNIFKAHNQTAEYHTSDGPDSNITP